MQCSCCAKWRRVDPGSVEALRSNNFFDVLPTDLDWEARLSGAGQRFGRLQLPIDDTCAVSYTHLTLPTKVRV